MKRVLVVFPLALVLLTPLLAGCAGKSAEEGKGQAPVGAEKMKANQALGAKGGGAPAKTGN